ncbi:hypothetical protein [Plantactinospora sonchi]|uniref:Thioesterase domain-containing protein n=1 Tax=Plantactinospora sonchi TaxID=1544735 RepID=A0ABU7RWR3_9ACTN
MAFDGWRALRPGDGPVLLGVDFSTARSRTVAGFADLAALLPEPYAVWGTDESTWRDVGRSPDDPPGAALSDWLDRTAPTVGEPGGLLGYCAGAALAGALARRLAQGRPTAPPVVLLDPSTVTAETLYDQFNSALDGIAGVLPEAEVRAARTAGRDDMSELLELPRLAARLSDRYAALARPACAAQGVPATIADQLCGRVDTYLRYLLLSSAAPLDVPDTALVVLSATHEPPPLPGVRQVRLDVPRERLLAEPRVAEVTVRALVGAPLAGRA